MKAYKTEQEEFWAGEFGSRYISRNQSNNLLGSNINFFSRSLKYGFGIKNVIEFGANIGMNLKALSSLYPEAELFGVEINKDAVEHLRIEIPKENIEIPEKKENEIP